MTIDILLPTYNGERWLAPQLDSLLAQTVQDWRLIVRDDGSTDDTRAVIETYRRRMPERLHLLEDGKHLGPARSFAVLLKASNADYVLCCDQDDVWMPDKIALTLAAMQETEGKYGKKTPVLVHTDASIVDENLAPIAASFARHHHARPLRYPLNRLLVQNMVHGCTLMANRALLSAALPVPEHARMHDMWLAQIASALGHIAYVDTPTVYYRQHANNVIGARENHLGNLKLRTQKTMRENITQAELLRDRIGMKLDKKQQRLLDSFLRLPRQGAIARRYGLLRNGFLRSPCWQNIPALLFA